MPLVRDHEARAHRNELPAERRAHAHHLLTRHRRRFPILPPDAAAISAALDPASPYFITTAAYWDCECPVNYIHPNTEARCPECGEIREESPDSRIGELKAHGIILDWLAPELLETYDQHNLAHRPGYPRE